MKMQHPEIKAAAEVLSREQFNTVYAPRGWELMEPAVEFANNNLGRFVASTDDLTKDEARALIAARGGDYPDAKATETQVRETYAEMFLEGTPRAVAATESATGVPLDLYDPAKHSVHPKEDGSDPGVLAYLGQADEDERQRVLDLERKGSARKTILEWTPADDEDETDSTPVDEKDEE